MRRTVLTLLLLAPLPVQASSNNHSPDQLCHLRGSWAATVMSARQAGIPLSSQLHLENAPGAGTRDEILAAYEHPRFSTAPMQQRAVEDYRNEVELRCFKNQ